MIRLVASDVDGTLLRGGQREISGRMLEIIRRLADRGVLFAAASGRAYHDLWKHFAPVADRMLFISHDGALVMYQGRALFSAPIAREPAMKLLERAWEESPCSQVVMGQRFSYYRTKNADFAESMRQIFGIDALRVDGFAGLRSDMLRLEFFCEDRLVYGRPPFTEEQSRLSMIYQEYGWCEYVAAGVNKGVALRQACRHFAVDLADTAAFGDNYNDKELLEAAGLSFAMDDAKPGLAELCGGRVCASVEDQLEKLFEMR